MIRREDVPCYYYEGSVIADKCRTLKTELSGFEFLYSIKTNPFQPIVDGIAKEGFGADAASAKEVEISLESGMKPGEILYSSTGKTAEDIERSFGNCILIADSFSELYRIEEEAKKREVVEEIGIRINPNFTMEDENSISSKFGIDMEQLTQLESMLKKCPHLKVIGIHIHIKSQELDFKKIGTYYLNCFEIAKQMNEQKGVDIKFINFGSGIGTLYDVATESPVELAKLSQMVKGMQEENKRTLKAILYIETGRFVVCNAGTYYTEIVDIKESRGIKYIIVKNGLNGFLRPSIANLLLKNVGDRELPGQEPLYTTKHAFEIQVLNESTETERVNIVGNLCTALDVLGVDLEVKKAKIGDLVSVSNAGSYGYSLSPLLFSSHEIPKQIYNKINL